MEITFRWYIYEMQVIPNFNGLNNFVTKITWRYNATNESGDTANIEGMTTYNTEPSNGFIDYNNLTENDVFLWLNSQENLMDLQNKLTTSIQEKLNPTVITLPLPW